MKKILIGVAIIAVIAIIALLGKPVSNMGADGYIFGQPQYAKQRIVVDIVTYKSLEDLQSKVKSLGVNNPDIAAFSTIKPPAFDHCTIHMIDPSVSYQPEFIGHEFTHCVYGQWHTDNNSRK